MKYMELCIALLVFLVLNGFFSRINQQFSLLNLFWRYEDCILYIILEFDWYVSILVFFMFCNFLLHICEMCCFVHLCGVAVVQSMHWATEIRCNNGISITKKQYRQDNVTVTNKSSQRWRKTYCVRTRWEVFPGSGMMSTFLCSDKEGTSARWYFRNLWKAWNIFFNWT